MSSLVRPEPVWLFHRDIPRGHDGLVESMVWKVGGHGLAFGI